MLLTARHRSAPARSESSTPGIAVGRVGAGIIGTIVGVVAFALVVGMIAGILVGVVLNILLLVIAIFFLVFALMVPFAFFTPLTFALMFALMTIADGLEDLEKVVDEDLLEARSASRDRGAKARGRGSAPARPPRRAAPASHSTSARRAAR